MKYLGLLLIGLIGQLQGRTLVTPDSYYPRFRRHNLKDAMKYRSSSQDDKTVMNFFGEPQILMSNAQKKAQEWQSSDKAVDFAINEYQHTIDNLHRDIGVLEEKNNKIIVELADKEKEYQREMFELRQIIANKEQEKNSLENEFDKMQRKLDAIKQENKELTTQLRKLERTNRNIEKERDQYARLVAQHEEDSAILEQEVSQLQQEIKELTNQNVDREKLNEKLIHEKELLQMNNEKMTERYNAIKVRLDSDIEKCNDTSSDIQNQYSEAKKELERVVKEKHDFEKQLARVEEKYDTCERRLQKELEELKGDKVELHEKLHECHIESREYEKTINDLKHEINKKALEYVALKNKSDIWQERNDFLKGKVAILKKEKKVLAKSIQDLQR